MDHLRAANVVVADIAVGLQDALELAQKPLRPFSLTAHPEVEDHAAPRSAVLPEIGLVVLAATVVLGTNTQLTYNSYGTYGSDGITVALLGRAKPWGVVFAGLLFGALQTGGTYVEAATLGQVPADIVEVLEGLIVLFVAAPALIRAGFRLRSTSDTGLEAVAKGWNG